MSRMTYLDASRIALAEEMRRERTVWAVGEDLGRGGVFGQYRGLVDEFGPERISDAPISEACILGAAVGAAMMGTRPVVEMRFSDFALCAVDEMDMAVFEVMDVARHDGFAAHMQSVMNLPRCFHGIKGGLQPFTLLRCTGNHGVDLPVDDQCVRHFDQAVEVILTV